MDFKNPQRTYNTLFIGAGPGGTGPIVCAAKQNRLDSLLDSSIAIVDRGPYMGQGTIGKYAVDADTVGGTLLECLQGQEDTLYKSVIQSRAALFIQKHRTIGVPLKVVGEFMTNLGTALEGAVNAHSYSQFFSRTEARAIYIESHGKFRVELVSRNNGTSGTTFEIQSQNLVMALGGRQNTERTLNAEIATGINLSTGYRSKVLFTDFALTDDGVADMRRRLQSASSHKVIIIGSSHSAFSAASTLLNKVGVEFGEGEITMLYRQKPKLFYPSAEEAHADGYFDFDDNDLCTLTKRVFRLSGLRLDSRELLRRIWGMSEAGQEKRVRLLGLDSISADTLTHLLDQAIFVIPAFGYRPNTVPIYDAGGQMIDLLGDQEGTPPLVDVECRVLARDGQPVPHLYGIGLASGYRPSGKLGGEPSFNGQTNGIWLYQHGIGEIILNQLI
jgi:hypothetical protein